MEEASSSVAAAGSRSRVSLCETKRGPEAASFYREAKGEGKDKDVRRRRSRVVGRLQRVGRSVLDLKQRLSSSRNAPPVSSDIDSVGWRGVGGVGE